MTERLRAVPPLLWVVIGALVLSAVTTIGPIVSGLSSTWGGAAGLVAIALPWLIVVTVPVAYARVGWALVEGSRTARASTVLLATLFVLLVAVAGLGGGFAVVAALLLAGATVVLVAPSTRAFFDGPLGRTGPRPPTIAVSRAALLAASAVAAAHAATTMLAGVVMLAYSASSSGVGASGGALGLVTGVFSGLVLLEAFVAAAVAALGFWAARGLDRGSRTARLALTIGIAVEVIPAAWYLAVTLPATAGWPLGVGAVAVVALHLAAALAPWLFPDARHHFAEPPLPAVTDLHRRLLDLGARSGAAPALPALPAPAALPTPFPPTAGAATPAPGAAAPAPASPAPRPAPGGRPPSTPFPAAPAAQPTRAAAPTSRHARPDADREPATSTPFQERTPSGRHARPEAAATTCSACGAGAQTGWSHCPHCGARISGRPSPEPQR